MVLATVGPRSIGSRPMSDNVPLVLYLGSDMSLQRNAANHDTDIHGKAALAALMLPALFLDLPDTGIHAEVGLRSIHLGVAAIGQLLELAADSTDASQELGSALPNLGRLLYELGQLSAVLACCPLTSDTTSPHPAPTDARR